MPYQYNKAEDLFRDMPAPGNTSRCHYPIEICSQFDANLIVEFLYNIEKCSSLQKLNNIIVTLRNLVDFSWCYCCVSRLDDNYGFLADSLTVAGDWPEEWFNRYLAERYYLIDPVIQKTFRKDGFPFLVWRSLKREDPIVQQFFSEAADFEIGLNSVSIGVKDPFNDSFGGILCAIGIDENEKVYSLFRFLAPYVFRSVLRLRMQQKRSTLNEQEKTFLYLFGNGIKRKSIASEHGISLRRVGQVLEQAAIKLDAHNTVHALNEAITEGMITLR